MHKISWNILSQIDLKYLACSRYPEHNISAHTVEVWQNRNWLKVGSVPGPFRRRLKGTSSATRFTPLLQNITGSAGYYSHPPDITELSNRSYFPKENLHWGSTETQCYCLRCFAGSRRQTWGQDIILAELCVQKQMCQKYRRRGEEVAAESPEWPQDSSEHNPSWLLRGCFEYRVDQKKRPRRQGEALP